MESGLALNMTTEKKPAKRPWVPEGSPHVQPQRRAAALMKSQVLAAADEIFHRYVNGESFLQISKSLPFEVPNWRMRTILMESEETRDLYANAAINRAHNLVEAAIDYGRQASEIGDAAGLRTAIDVNLKVAAKMAPREYGDIKKLELTGQNGGPIKMVALTDEQLMEIASRGAAPSEDDEE